MTGADVPCGHCDCMLPMPCTCPPEEADPAERRCVDCGSDQCDGYPLCHIPEAAL